MSLLCTRSTRSSTFNEENKYHPLLLFPTKEVEDTSLYTRQNMTLHILYILSYALAALHPLNIIHIYYKIHVERQREQI
jgi:hypothetical protein